MARFTIVVDEDTAHKLRTFARNNRLSTAHFLRLTTSYAAKFPERVVHEAFAHLKTTEPESRSLSGTIPAERATASAAPKPAASQPAPAARKQPTGFAFRTVLKPAPDKPMTPREKTNLRDRLEERTRYALEIGDIEEEYKHLEPLDPSEIGGTDG